MKELKISIIVCPHDSANLLKKTLDSLRYQNFEDFELVIVDRNSTDNTKMIIEKYKKIFGAKLRWASLSGDSLEAAMNEGVKMAKGEYLTILDTGELLPQDSLAQALKCAQKYPQADVAYGVENIWEKSKKIKGYLDAQADILPAKNKFASNLYYRKDLHQKFGFYGKESQVVEDYAFCLKAFYLGQAIVRPFDLVSQEIAKSQFSIINS